MRIKLRFRLDNGQSLEHTQQIFIFIEENLRNKSEYFFSWMEKATNVQFSFEIIRISNIIFFKSNFYLLRYGIPIVIIHRDVKSHNHIHCGTQRLLWKHPLQTLCYNLDCLELGRLDKNKNHGIPYRNIHLSIMHVNVVWWVFLRMCESIYFLFKRVCRDVKVVECICSNYI